MILSTVQYCLVYVQYLSKIKRQTVFHLFRHVMRVARLRNITTTTATASTVTHNLSKVSVLATATTGDIGHFQALQQSEQVRLVKLMSHNQSYFLAFGMVWTPLVPSAVMRLTSTELKGFQQAIQLLFIRICGCIPGTVVTGWLIDASCLLWTEEEDGTKSSCFIYDNDQLTLKYLLPGQE